LMYRMQFCNLSAISRHQEALTRQHAVDDRGSVVAQFSHGNFLHAGECITGDTQSLGLPYCVRSSHFAVIRGGEHPDRMQG
jgi:hypothetical protein